MAELVLGMALSHGPMLSTPPDAWDQRARADRDNPEHWFRGKAYDYASLAAFRSPGFGPLCTLEERTRRHAACARAVRTLARKLGDARIDLAVIVGNDQMEVFREDMIGALTVYTGAEIENLPLSEEQSSRLPFGIEIAMSGYCPPQRAVYPGAPGAALALASSLADQEFDVSTSARLPKGPDRQHGIPHAYGYVYRNVMCDAPPPSVPLFLNVGVAPTQPRVRRCLKLGVALERAIAALPGNLRVALIASGGLSHFAVDENFDREVLRAMQQEDELALSSLDESWFNGNSCEIKSWLPVASAMRRLERRMTLVDYVPCYRTEAGTGQGMGFAYWE